MGESPKYNTNSKLTERDFKRISQFIIDEFGINITPNKKFLLEYRLQKRLIALRLANYELYTQYLFSQTGQLNEPLFLIDAVSTNKTDFFREVGHFNVLYSDIIPAAASLLDQDRILKCWSAGCSSGEEVYSMAITLERYRKLHPEISYQILGTDISSEILQVAKKAVYERSKTGDIPLRFLKEYFLVHKDPMNETVRVTRRIRDLVHFSLLNLMDPYDQIPGKFQIIFCRNTLIYFNQINRDQILKRLSDKLLMGGYLFVSHTESLIGNTIGLTQVFPSVYQKKK